jgi:hypothetical protein
MNRARFVASVIAGAAVFAAGASAAAASTVRVDPLQPLSKTRADTVASTNWSGYAVQSASKFTDVTGTWVEPTATCSSSASQDAAFWAGIDGYASRSVEQLGTFANCAGRSKPSYSAWWEMYPASSVALSTSQYPVKPGDSMSAEVSVSGTSFTLSLLSSEGWRFSTVQSGSGLAQASAEVIAESPEVCLLGIFCHIVQLTNFGTADFSNAQAAVNGGADQPFSAFTADSGPHEIIGETSSKIVKAQPSALSPGGDAFTVTWKHT